MGCTPCKSDLQQPEIQTQPNVQLGEEPKQEKVNELSKLFAKLQALGFTEHTFSKETEHEISYDRLTQKWSKKDQKVVFQKGVLNPINIENLKQANIYLKEQRQSAQANAALQLDENMTFQCALQEGHPFPLLNVTILKNDESKEQIIFQPNQTGLIRSWNLGEQMLNFERIIEFTDTMQQKLPSLSVQLVGLCRGTKDQRSSYESCISSNNWQQYKHIFLDQDELNDEGWMLDVDYDTRTGAVDRQNILSTILVIDGNVVWKRYDNEWNFASDADEVEAELQLLLNSPNKVPERENMNGQQVISQLSKEQHKKLRQALTSLPNTYQTKYFSRDLRVKLQKSVLYQNGKPTTRVIKPPQVNIASTPKSKDQTDQLVKQLSEYTSEVNCLYWDKKIFIAKLESILKENKIDVFASSHGQVQVVLEVSIRVKGTNQGVEVDRKPWEETPFFPRYPSTTYINQIKQWILARDRILPKLQGELQNATDAVQKVIIQKSFDFFRAIPGVVQPLNSPYGPAKFCEHRSPPYEDLLVSKALGDDSLRKTKDILLLYLIDYENEDSVKILKDIIKLKRDTPQYMQQMQLAVLGHIRAESWTKLFQAFVDKAGITKDIQEGVVETWFPIEDKISSLSFLAIMGKVYGLQLERKDIMIVDKDNYIVQLESSRKIVAGLSQMLNQNSSQPALGSQQQWNKLKEWTKNTNISTINYDFGLQADLDKADILAEQRVLKTWDFVGGQSLYSELYMQPIINEKFKLPKEILELKSQLGL